MITKDDFKDFLVKLGFSIRGDKFTKKFKETDAYLKVDFKAEKRKNKKWQTTMCIAHSTLWDSTTPYTER